MAFKVNLQPSGHDFDAAAGVSLLDSALEASIHLPYGCRNGACGACKGKIVEGRVDHGKALPHALTDADKAAGLALMCCAQPLSDLVVECREAKNEKDVPVKTMPVRVQKMEKVAADVMVVQLKLPEAERLQFLAGQYIDFLLKDGKRRSFSIANPPQHDEFLEVHVRLVAGGLFTEHVFNGLKEKDILRIEGPHGSFQLQEDSLKPIIMLAGGTGFAPIQSIVEHTIHNRIHRPLVIYVGSRDRAGLYRHELALRWAAENKHITYVPVLSEPTVVDAWSGRTGLAHLAVLEDHPDLSGFQVYACGAPAMIDVARKDYADAGLAADNFLADAFTFAAS